MALPFLARKIPRWENSENVFAATTSILMKGVIKMAVLIICLVLLIIISGILGAELCAHKIARELVKAEKNGEIIFVEKIEP